MKILQWNCLADTLADPKAFPFVNPSHLKWDHRAPLIAESLLKLNCDIYCLQEIDRPEFFQSILKNYSYIYQKKQQNQDGTMIIYKNELKLIDTLIVPYLDKEKPANQFYIKAKFEKFTLFVTHLKAKVPFEDIRKEQLIQLNKDLVDEKIILCGDFNTQPHLEAVTNFCDISNMISVNKDQVTTSKNRGILETNIKDYIFYRGVVLKEWHIPKVELGECGLPRDDFPSDHMYIYGVFDI